MFSNKRTNGTNKPTERLLQTETQLLRVAINIKVQIAFV